MKPSERAQLRASARVASKVRSSNRRNENFFERLFYEAQPYFYLALSAYTVTQFPQSKLGNASALMLIFSAFLILRWRLQFRSSRK